ncbi:MAG: hypothetical protein WCV63_09565 [Negativicutes bacterium]|jgi:hypothetical protein
MNKIKISHILRDSKFHILAISTLLCVQITTSFSMGGTAVLYCVLAVWMVADYRLVLMLDMAKTAILAFLLPAIAVSAINLVMPWNNIPAGAARLMVVVVIVALVFDLLGEAKAKRLGLIMAVVIEILVPTKDQPGVFALLVLDSIIGVGVALATGFVYYNLTEYSAYLKHKKKIFNELRLCELLGNQLERFFAGADIDWPVLRLEINEFKDNRFFYNRAKPGDADQVKLFYDLVLEIYCLLTMLRGFQVFDAESINEAQAVFPNSRLSQPTDSGKEFYCENIGARSALFNYQLLQDIIAQRVNSYKIELRA